jgi:hypothetical protein
MNTNSLSVGQIVTAANTKAVFAILSFRTIDGECYAQLKEVNPNHPYQMRRGELALPVAVLAAY